MEKWHINKKGEASRCNAATKPCPLRGETIHGNSKEEVQQKFEKLHKDKNLKTFNKNSHLTKNQTPKAKKEFKDREFPVLPDTVAVPHDPNAKYAVLSDVDGTLTRGSFVLDHAIYLHDRGIIDLGDLAEKWKKDPKNEKIISELAEDYRSKIYGMNIKDLKVDEFLDEYENIEGKFYSTLNQLKTFKERGWEIQLISGSPDFLIRPFAERHGFFGKGSDYHMDTEGNINGEMDGMFGQEAKRGFIQKLNVGRFKRVLAFGDTASDTPLFENANHTTLVDPSEETASKIKTSLTIRE